MMIINADQYVETDEELIPTGKIKKVDGTPLDFRKFAPMSQGISDDHDQIIKDKGYAAAMVIKNGNSEKKQKVAEAYSKESGIKMEVFSNQRSLQIYNAFFFNGTDIGKQGEPYIFSGGFIFETQGFPDAVNNPNFPSIVLEPQKIYNHYTSINFSVLE